MVVQNDFVNDSRIIKEASTLGENGFKVKVLALHNDGLKEEENFDNFKVKRLKLSTRNRLGKNKLAQIVKYVEFRNKCLSEAIKFNPDIVHCHDVYTLPIGEKIVDKLGVKLIYDSHELWAHASNNITMPKILLNLQNNIENRVIRKCQGVITVSESIVNYLEKEYNLSEKPVLLRNIPKKSNIIKSKNMFYEDLDIDEDKKIVLYQGVVGTGRGIEKLMKSMQYIKNNNIVLVILGNGPKVDYYKEMAYKLNIEGKVYFHKAVDQSILMNYTSSAHVGMSLIKNICLSYYYSLPNKMFEYIQSEIPVICSNYPDMKNIVDKYGVGKSVDPDNNLKIAESIEEILENNDTYDKYKENCKCVKEELNWEVESKKLIELYNKVLNLDKDRINKK